MCVRSCAVLLLPTITLNNFTSSECKEAKNIQIHLVLTRNPDITLKLGLQYLEVLLSVNPSFKFERRLKKGTLHCEVEVEVEVEVLHCEVLHCKVLHCEVTIPESISINHTHLKKSAFQNESLRYI